MTPDRQQVPVRMYATDDYVVVAAPMPGLEPGNISVVIGEGSVTVQGEERGPGQHRRDLLLAEWTIGPYERKVELPGPVNSYLANATYDNGVLVVSMPKAARGQPGVPAEFRLERIGPASAWATRAGRTGRTRPRSTCETKGRADDQRLLPMTRRSFRWRMLALRGAPCLAGTYGRSRAAHARQLDETRDAAPAWVLVAPNSNDGPTAQGLVVLLGGTGIHCDGSVGTRRS